MVLPTDLMEKRIYDNVSDVSLTNDKKVVFITQTGKVASVRNTEVYGILKCTEYRALTLP